MQRLQQTVCLILVLAFGFTTIQCSDGNTINSPLEYFIDADGDGFGNPAVSTTANEAPEGYVENNSDCNDNDAGINPSINESETSLVDLNCDGLSGSINIEECPDGSSSTTYYLDNDQDGYGLAGSATSFCNKTDPEIVFCTGIAVEGSETCQHYSQNDSDCNDEDSHIFPGSSEILADGIDQDCSGQDKVLVKKEIQTLDATTLILSNSKTLEYNDEGLKTVTSKDTDGDGVFDTVQTFTYDLTGSTITSIQVDDAGACLFKTFETRDGQDQKTTFHKDTDCDDINEEINTWVITYDADQQITSKLRTEQLDTDNDGTFETNNLYGQTWSYNAENIVTSKVETLNAGDNRFSEYNADGLEVKRIIDTNKDGAYDKLLRFSFDENNHLVKKEQFNYDPVTLIETLQKTLSYENDEFGSPTKIITTDATGTETWHDTFTNTYSE